MDIGALLRTLIIDGTIPVIARNGLAQFGRRSRRYLGAEFLPERLQTENEYTEEDIRYRSIIANAGTRYSPVQLKKGVLAGSFSVKLAESDIGSEMTGRDYDSLLKMLPAGGGKPSMEAVAAVTRFLDTTVNIPLVEWNERARWQAIINAVVQLRGDNGYTEDVQYSAPAGHRPTIAVAWSNVATDPYIDIYAIVQMLADKGFTVSRIVTSRRVLGIMSANPKVAARTNRIIVSTTGQISGMTQRVQQSDLNTINAADGLPPFEMYELSYRTSTGSGRFMPNDTMTFFCQTGRDAEIDIAETAVSEVLPDTLGYTGIGRPAGQSAPGRVIKMEAFDRKPPRIEAEGWQTSLPVITEPEAIAVLKGIS